MALSTTLLLFACAALGTPKVRVVSSPAAGLGLETGVGRLDPSDILRFGDQYVVLYSKVTGADALYPAPYAGEIWWASSLDGGHAWTERGKLLGAGPRSSPDAKGVFDPNVFRDARGELSLYYSGIDEAFNFRFQRQGVAEPVHLLRARLNWDPTTRSLSAERQDGARGVLSPSPADAQGFDSLRVRSATPLLRNGLIYLYYQGLAFNRGTDKSLLGLAVAGSATSPFKRQHEGRALLPFHGNALLGQHKHGIFALFTGSNRGVWWAADGEHFAPLDVRVSGRLESPGLYRDEIGAEFDAQDEIWGLHVARTNPDPWIERFDLELVEVLPEAVASRVPIPSGFVDQRWTGSGSWMSQHSRSRVVSSEQHPEFVLLGDGMVADFGGHSRSTVSTGQASWERLFASRQAANLGISGDRTPNVLWRVDHGALPSTPIRAILVDVGARQIGQETPEEIALGVGTILRRLRAKRPQSELVLTSLLVSPSMDEAARADVASTNVRLRRLARQPSIRFVDLEADFASQPEEERRALFGPDGKHLSAAGYARWAAMLEPLFDDIERLIPETAHDRLGKTDR